MHPGEDGAEEHRGNEKMRREEMDQGGDLLCLGRVSGRESGPEERPGLWRLAPIGYLRPLLGPASPSPAQILWEGSRSWCQSHFCCPEPHATWSQ